MTGYGGPEAGRGVSRVFGASIREVGDFARGEIVLESVAPVLPHLTGPDGELRTGALLGLVDNVGGLCGGLGALPDGWVVSTNLMARRVRGAAPRSAQVRLRSRVLRRGKSAVVTSIEAIHDDQGHVVADAVLTSSILVPANGVPQWRRPVLLEPDGPLPADLPPLVEWAGVQPDGAHGVLMAVRDELRNPWGILHGGMVALLVDIAAEHEAATATDTPHVTTDVVVHFLAPARVGPVRAEVRALGTRADGRVARVELRDQGAADRVVAIAVTTARRC